MKIHLTHSMTYRDDLTADIFAQIVVVATQYAHLIPPDERYVVDLGLQSN